VAGLACGGAALVAAGTVLGITLGGTGRQPAAPALGALPPPPGERPGPVSTQLTSGPAILLNQNTGDGNTGFVVHGSGWIPGRRMTIAILGLGKSPDRPTVDERGTFNYAINQNHEFHPGRFPPGRYELVVTESGGGQERTSFLVVVPPPSPSGRPPGP
jgi:hypothetical protein